MGPVAAHPGPWQVLVLEDLCQLVPLRSECALNWGRGHFQTADCPLWWYFWEG